MSLSVLPVLKRLEFHTLVEPLLVAVAASKQIGTPGRFASLKKLNLLTKSHTVSSLCFLPQLEELWVDLYDFAGLTREGLLIISKLKNLRSLRILDDWSDGNLHSRTSCSELISYFSDMKMLEQLGLTFLFSDGMERTVSTSDLVRIAKHHPKLRRLSLPPIDGFIDLRRYDGPLFPELDHLSSCYLKGHYPTEIEAFNYTAVLITHCPKIEEFYFLRCFKNKIREVAEICIKGRMHLEKHPDSTLGTTVLDYHIAGVGVVYRERLAAQTAGPTS
ncbi:hypothetical protein E4T47_04434 [Aureobasidium subglaciale]|nr:hypothetical protein E4T47_04434 [Aureobasidium subglaciale]